MLEGLIESKIKPQNIRPKSYEMDGLIVRKSFYSEVLNQDRTVDIYLPPSYAENTEKRYPVVYMHDGNNLFEAEESFANEDWEVDSTIEKLLKINQIEEVIAVGIHNTISRDDDYTWVEMINEEGYTEGGKGAKYAEFIVEELKEYMDSKYRTLPDRENTAVIGSSLGGLISLYLSIHYPEIFSKIGAMSASLWWADGVICKHIKEIDTDLKIWLDMGTREDMDRDLFLCIKETLISRGYIEGENVVYLEDKGADHNERDWAKRLHLPLLFFFSKK